MTEPDPRAKEGLPQLPEASKSKDAHEGSGKECGAESGSDKSDGRYYRTPCLEACNTPEEQRAEIRQHLFYNVRYYLLELDLLPDALLTRRDKMAGYITNMLMEMPDDGAFRLVGNLEALQFKVVEGVEILIDSVHPQTPDHSIADHPPHAPQYSAPEGDRFPESSGVKETTNLPTVAELDNMGPDERLELLFSLLHPLVHRFRPELPNQVTCILLKSTAPSEIVELLQCPDSDMFTDEVDAAYETWIEEQGKCGRNRSFFENGRQFYGVEKCLPGDEFNTERAIKGEYARCIYRERQIEDIRHRIRQQAAQLAEEAQDMQLARHAPKPPPRFSVQDATEALSSAMRAPTVTGAPIIFGSYTPVQELTDNSPISLHGIGSQTAPADSFGPATIKPLNAAGLADSNCGIVSDRGESETDSASNASTDSGCESTCAEANFDSDACEPSPMQAEVDSDKATPVSPGGWEDDFIEREVLTGMRPHGILSGAIARDRGDFGGRHGGLASLPRVPTAANQPDYTPGLVQHHRGLPRHLVRRRCRMCSMILGHVLKSRGSLLPIITEKAYGEERMTASSTWMHLLSPEKSPAGPAVIKVTANCTSASAPSAPSMRSMPADSSSSPVATATPDPALEEQQTPAADADTAQPQADSEALHGHQDTSQAQSHLEQKEADNTELGLPSSRALSGADASEAAAEDPAVGEQLDTAPAVNGTQPETPHGHNLVQPQAEQSEAGDTERSKKQQPGISLANPDEPSSPADVPAARSTEVQHADILYNSAATRDEAEALDQAAHPASAWGASLDARGQPVSDSGEEQSPARETMQPQPLEHAAKEDHPSHSDADQQHPVFAAAQEADEAPQRSEYASENGHQVTDDAGQQQQQHVLADADHDKATEQPSDEEADGHAVDDNEEADGPQEQPVQAAGAKRSVLGALVSGAVIVSYVTTMTVLDAAPAAVRYVRGRSEPTDGSLPVRLFRRATTSNWAAAGYGIGAIEAPSVAVSRLFSWGHQAFLL